MTVSEIYTNGFIDLSFKYARLYQQDGKSFIGCFLKFKSIRDCCNVIVAAYKRVGAYKELKGDFTEWANKQPTDQKELLADTIKIIYNLIERR